MSTRRPRSEGKNGGEGDADGFAAAGSAEERRSKAARLDAEADNIGASPATDGPVSTDELFRHSTDTVGTLGMDGSGIGAALGAADASPLDGVEAGMDVVVGFGSAADGQLSVSASDAVKTPVITTLQARDLESVHAGAKHSWARSRQGVVWTTGSNDFGELGRGGRPTRFQQVGALDLMKVVDVTAGQGFSVAVTNTGKAVSMGVNSAGQLGTGTRESSSKPKTVQLPAAGGADPTGGVGGFSMPASRMRQLVQVSSGAQHSISLSSDGTVLSWGANQHGQLGNGLFDAVTKPQIVPSLRLRPVVLVAAGSQHSIALTSAGNVWAWGSNQFGQLGLGDTRNRPRPDQVTSIRNTTVVHAAAGGGHTLLCTATGVVLSMGRGGDGQLGTGGTTSSVDLPRQVDLAHTEGTLIDRVSAGASHSAIWSSKGDALFMFGSNRSGQLGLGTVESRPIPTKLDLKHFLQSASGERGLVSVSCGTSHTLLLFAKEFGQRRAGLPPSIARLMSHQVRSLVDGLHAKMKSAVPDASAVGDMKIGQMRSLLDNFGVDHRNVLERAELEQRVRSALSPGKQQRSCGNCSKKLESKPLRCGRCKAEWYCTRDCQKRAWPTHKGSCGTDAGGSGGGDGASSSSRMLSPDHPLFKDALDPLIQVVEQTFESVSLLNASFLPKYVGSKRRQRASQIGATRADVVSSAVHTSRSGVHVRALRRTYKLLLSTRSERVAATMMRAVGRCLDRLAAPAGPGHAGAIDANDPETLRVFLIILLNPLLLLSRAHLSVVEKLSSLLIRLPKHAKARVLEWLFESPSEDIAQVIHVLQRFITIVMTTKNLRSIDFSPAVVLLDMLHQENEAQRMVPPSLFYNRAACSTVSLEADLVRYRDTPAAFSLCKYPWLLPLATKQQILLVNARDRMFDAVGRAVVDASAVARSVASASAQVREIFALYNDVDDNGAPSGSGSERALGSNTGGADAPMAEALPSDAGGGGDGGADGESMAGDGVVIPGQVPAPEAGDAADDVDLGVTADIMVEDVGHIPVHVPPPEVSEHAEEIAGLGPSALVSPVAAPPVASVADGAVEAPAAAASAPSDGTAAHGHVDPDLFALHLRVRRSHVLSDAIVQLSSRLDRDPMCLQRPLRVSFVGEDGIDEGGVRKEFFEILIRKLFDIEVTKPDDLSSRVAPALFVEQDDARLAWFSPTMTDEGALARYTMIGRIIGLATFNDILLNVPIPLTLVFRVLTDRQLSLEDLRLVQPSLARSLEAVLDWDEDANGATIEDVFALSHAIDLPGSPRIGAETWKHVELVPLGERIAVTQRNRDNFVRKYINSVLSDSVAPQLGAFYAGWRDAAGNLPVALCRPEELETLVCGTPELSGLQDLQAGARYVGPFHDDHIVIKWFWQVVHAWPERKQRKLLQFATGSDRVPVRGLQSLRFTLQRAGDDDDRVPVAHTCFSTLDLPEYSSKATLAARLDIALDNVEGFGLV